MLPLVICLTLLWMTPAGVAGQSHPPSEYEVKAALVLNFLRYTESAAWVFADGEAPIVVGVLGRDPFGTTLERVLGDERAHDRRIVIRRADYAEDLKGCHLVFVSQSERDRLAEVLAALGQRGLMTVGELPDFARRGGVVNFYIEDSKVRFEINQTAADRKDLRMSSQLLKRARVIQ
jgi:hypothetical protein